MTSPPPAFLLAYSCPVAQRIVDGMARERYVRLVLPIATVNPLNVREHWATRARRAKKQRGEAYMLTASLKSLVLPATIILTRVSPRLLDEGDNLPASCKFIRDGIADRLGIDDSDPRVTWLYDQRRGKPKEKAVIVEATR